LLRQRHNAALVYFKVLVSPSKQFEFETPGVWFICAIKTLKLDFFSNEVELQGI